MSVAGERFITDSQGRKTAVVVPIRRYEKMIEDLHDLAVVAKRRREKPISSEKMKKRLKKDGLP